MFRESVITLGARGIIFALALGSNVIITRSLGPAARGSFDVMVVLLSLMLLVTSFSIETANVYYGAKDTTRIPVLIGNSLVAALSFGSLGALIFLWLSGWAPLQNHLIDNSIAPAQLSAFMAILPLFLAAAYLREIVRSAGDIVRYNLAALLQAVVYLIGSILFVFILQLNILGAILAFSMAQISLCLYVLFVALRIAGWRIRLGWSDFIPTFRYGFQLYPGMIAQFLNYRVDMLLVAYFMTPTFVGYYALAVSLAEKIFEIPHAIRTALLHRVAQSSDTRNVTEMTLRAISLSSMLVAGICVSLAICAYPLILILFGRDFLPATPALLALLPGVWILGTGKLVTTHLAGIGLPRVGTYAALASLLLTILLDLIFIPYWGIIGASLVSSFSYFVFTIIAIRAFQRNSGYRLRLFDLSEWSVLVASLKRWRPNSALN